MAALSLNINREIVLEGIPNVFKLDSKSSEGGSKFIFPTEGRTGVVYNILALLNAVQYSV